MSVYLDTTSTFLVNYLSWMKIITFWYRDRIALYGSISNLPTLAELGCLLDVLRIH